MFDRFHLLLQRRRSVVPSCAAFALQPVGLGLPALAPRRAVLGGCARVECGNSACSAARLRGHFGSAIQIGQQVLQSRRSGRTLSRVRASRSRRPRIAHVERHHFIGDVFQARLALLDLARNGPLADEPAAVDMRVEVAVGEVAAHETFAGDARCGARAGPPANRI